MPTENRAFMPVVAFSGAFLAICQLPKMQNIVTNKYGITEATKKDAKTDLINDTNWNWNDEIHQSK